MIFVKTNTFAFIIIGKKTTTTTKKMFLKFFFLCFFFCSLLGKQIFLNLICSSPNENILLSKDCQSLKLYHSSIKLCTKFKDEIKLKKNTLKLFIQTSYEKMTNKKKKIIQNIYNENCKSSKKTLMHSNFLTSNFDTDIGRVLPDFYHNDYVFLSNLNEFFIY